MAAAMVRQQSGQRFRSGRFRGRHSSTDENVQLDFTKDRAENVKEILSYIIRQHGYSKAKKLGYLNVFVKLIDRVGDVSKLGFPLRNILICLSVNLQYGAKEVRAGTLRVIKHLINDEESLQVLLDLHIDYFIARSLDMCLDNEIERIHAQKLARKIATAVPSKAPRSLLNPLIAIGNDGAMERDRMVRASLACICELTYQNPDLVAHCGGISMLLRKILDCHQYPRINESLVATILHLVNRPQTRHFIQIDTDLEQLVAPFTDCHFSYTGETTDPISEEERESRFAASRMAIITVMRSWPGIVRFCRPDGTGLQSLIGILYLPFSDIRQAILEMIYELFQLTVPTWTEDFEDALQSTDPSQMRENWRLSEGFVADEGKFLLPNMTRVRSNLVENHMALLLAAWIGAGALDALVEVIITAENELFIRAVILLGELLQLAHQLLPADCSHHSHYLPTLMALASSFDIPNSRRYQASVAVNYLNSIHALKKRGPIPCSLYLDQLVKQSNSYKDKPLSLNIEKNKLIDMHVRKRAASLEEVCAQSMKDSQVLNSKDSKSWNWSLVEYVLKWPDDKLRKLEDQIHSRFIKRLVFFYKPTNHLFSRMESDHKLEKKLATIGCQLMDFLLRCDQEEGGKMMMDFLSDLALCLSEVALQRIAPESVLSSGNVISTLSHYYFLFVGRLSITGKGDRLIEKSGIYQHYLDIVSSAPQDSYVKLITSSLYYGRDGNTRPILSKALCAAPETGRLYSTKLLRVLLRANVAGFSQWGVDLLVNQLYDQSRAVAMTALSIVDEACEVKENLDSVVKMKPSFLHLGEKGVMILCRYMSTQEGFKFLTEANYTLNELKKWHTSFNTRYVGIVEELLNEALTTYEKTYEGSYTRRSSKRRQKKDVFIPIHLYGQLVQHKESFQLLRTQSYIEGYFSCIHCHELKTDEEILQLKTSLWAVGHIGMSSWGVSWLQEEKIIPEIIRLAEECAVYSIRGTAFFILGMLASTREGAEILSQYGWESRWNTRSERWPLVEDRSMLLEDSMEDLRLDMGYTSTGGARFDLGSPVSNLDFIAEENFPFGKVGKNRLASETDGRCYSDDDDSDSESGIVIPSVQRLAPVQSPELQRQGNRIKSQTLPYDNHGVRKLQALPARSQTFRSISVKHKTRSVEHISAIKDFNRLHGVNRSQSMKWEVTSKSRSDSMKHSSSVIPNKLSKERLPKASSDKTVTKHSNEGSGSLNKINDTSVTKDSNESGVSVNKIVSEVLVKDSCESSVSVNKIEVDVSKSVISNAEDETDKGGNSIACESVQHFSLPEDTASDKDVSIEQKLEVKLEITEEILCDSESETVEKLESVVVHADQASMLVHTEHAKASNEQNQDSPMTESSIKIRVTDTDRDQLVDKDKSEALEPGEKDATVKASAVSDQDVLNSSAVSHDTGSSRDASEQSAVPVCHSVEQSTVSPCDNVEGSCSRLDSRDGAGSMKKVVSLKDERSSSSESSRTSKSRTDSFNTDSVTSGVGSYDSGHHGVMELPSLSPIASTSSLDLGEVQMRHKDTKETKDLAHPSMTLRRMSNLSRVPSIRKQNSPAILPGSKFFDFSENAITYTSARDAHGYAALRSLMKSRQISSDVESDYGLNHLYETSSVSSRRGSIDSTMDVRRPASIMRNMSGVSLSDMDSGVMHEPRAKLYHQRPHTGQAEFMGLSLPVDINMMFEVTDAEEGHSQSLLGTGISRQTSFVERVDVRMERSDSGLEDLARRVENVAKISRSRTSSTADVVPAPLSSEHNVEICIQCGRVRQDNRVSQTIQEGQLLDERPEAVTRVVKETMLSRSRTSSMDTSGSQTSSTSDSSSIAKLSLDTTVGRTLVRKEIIRFVINLSSSVGVKGAEQGLLSLKQKFPKAFQDLCFYSEVSYFLGLCSFRLTARRFIQELFEEIDTSKILEEARDLLGVDGSLDKNTVDRSLPEDFDGFGDNFT